MTRIGAIDQGTTSTRILVADGDGVSIARSAAHTTTRPRPGWVEQDALEIVGNIEACIAAGFPLDRLGFANQGESCLAWDAISKAPLSPIIVWQDSRTTEELDRFGPDDVALIARIANLPVDPYFSASKLGWLVREVPAVRTAHAAGRLRLGTTEAFFLDRLAGTFATDIATASRTSLLDVDKGMWSAELCDLFGVPIECLPPILPNVGDFGSIGGVPVRASIVDQQAALYGHGCRAPGDAKITFGTGAFALALTGDRVELAQASGLLPTLAWDIGEGPVHALDGGVYDVGSAIDWALRAGLAETVADFASFEGSAAAIDRDLVFVPAFSGLAAPVWDRHAAPLMVGLTADDNRASIRQALLEGIAFSTAEVIGAMAAATPIGDVIGIDGGVSRSPYFVQFLADSLGRAVRVSGFSDLTALGVASLVAGEPIASGAGSRLVEPRIGADLRQSRAARFIAARDLSRNWRR